MRGARARRRLVLLLAAAAGGGRLPSARADAPAPSRPLDLVAPGPSGEPRAPQEPLRLHVGLRASGGADFAALPAPAPGAEIAVVLLFGKSRVEILGSAWLPEPARAATTPGSGAELSLLAAGARYCRALEQGRLELAGCAGIEAGAVLGRSFGTTPAVSFAAPWVAPGLGLLGLWNVSPSFSFTLALDGLVLGGRAPFTRSGIGPTYTPSPLTGRTLLGLEARFR